MLFSRHSWCMFRNPLGITKGDKIRIGCLNPAFWEAHKWAEILHTRGSPTKRTKSKQKNQKKNPMVSLILPIVQQIDPTGV